MSTSVFLTLAAAMFSIGLYGVLTRKNVLGVLLSLELMANSVNINLVAFSRHLGDSAGQVFALFAVALTVAEVVVGLAIVIFMHRSRKSVELDVVGTLKG